MMVQFVVVTVVFICLIKCSITETSESLVVQTESGSVRGYKSTDGIYEFYGIPYAKAPTGTSRFKAPLSPDPWVKTFDATNQNIVCPQASELTIGKQVKEDCLIANVFVPGGQENLTVLVVIHGGAYFRGYGNSAKYNNLINTKNIIVVTFNYRLGAHGFLCLGTDDVPGNAGMKDMVALLKWVRNNIASFGGNPEDVTISGCSAGGASVDLLTLSPSAKGLFNKFIQESSGSLGQWTVQLDPIQNAKEYAKMINCTDVSDVEVLEDFYKSVSYDNLFTDNVIRRMDNQVLMVPCIERDLGQEVFLSDDPMNIFLNEKHQKLPMLAGYANMEGIYRTNMFDLWKDLLNENFGEFIPVNLNFETENDRYELTNKIKQFYFGNKSISEESILDFVDYYSDILFVYQTMKSVNLQWRSGNANVYLYEYEFVDEDISYVPYTNIRGANHCTQRQAVADSPNELNITEEYKEMKRIIRTYWTNFVTTGKPSENETNIPSWPPVGKDWSPLMSLNVPSTLKNSLPLDYTTLFERTMFWENIYDQYRLEAKPA